MVALNPTDYGESPTVILGRVESAAIEYAEYGWHVFPAPPGTRRSHKSAARSGGAPWGATTDPEEIRHDWRQWPNANVGIRCGPLSGIFILDVDTVEGHDVDGLKTLHRLTEQHGDLPPTVLAVTPTGGRHIYFRWPAGGGVPNSASKVGPGIDVRGDGGMVIGPPSVKPDEGEYRWVNPPHEAEIADCPAWLLELIRAPRASEANGAARPATAPPRQNVHGSRQENYALKALDENAAELVDAAHGERNDKLNRIAYRMGRFISAGMIDDATVRAALEAACEANGLWKDDGPQACRATIDSGIKGGRNQPHIGLSDDGDPLDGFGAIDADEPPVARDDKGVAGTSWRRQNLVTMPAREFLYGRLLQRGKVTVTVAPGGVGKSALTGATEALAMATGRKLLHDHVPAPLRVWVWNLEEDQDELNRRLEAACVHFGIEGEVDGLFVDNGFDMPCRMATADRTGTTIIRPLTDAIVAEVQRLEVDVLVIDPFVSTHFVNENDNGAIDAVAKEWARVANDAGCAIHLVHHTTKLRGVEATVEASRGASALVNAARFARALNPMTEDEASTYGLKEGWRYFRATDGKANYAPRAESSQWFAHASVHLPNGDNVGVVTPFTLPDVTAGVTVDHLDEVVRRARIGDYREASQSPDWIGYLIADVVGADLEVPADKNRVKASLAMWLKSGALRVVERRCPKKREVKKFVVPDDLPEGSE